MRKIKQKEIRYITISNSDKHHAWFLRSCSRYTIKTPGFTPITIKQFAALENCGEDYLHVTSVQGGNIDLRVKPTFVVL